MKIKYQAKVDENGNLIIYNRKDFFKDVALLTGKEVAVSVTKWQKKRSTLQNSYYWGIVVPMVRAGLIDLGHRVDTEETHELLKYKFAQRELINEVTGESIKTIGSTTKMNTVEFSNFIEQIQQWSAEFLGVVIPDPNEALTIDFENK